MSCSEVMGWESWGFWKIAFSWDSNLGEASWDLKLGEASPVCGLRDALRVCWVSELRFWLWTESSAGELTERQCVTYWPRPSCQKKKCTCVNNRCIRSKISGDHGITLTVVGLNWVQMWRSQEVGWTSNHYITPVTGSSDQSERRCLNENHVPAEAGSPGPPGWAAQENGKEMLL